MTMILLSKIKYTIRAYLSAIGIIVRKNMNAQKTVLLNIIKEIW